ncbi:MAG: tetratricopeptide repeat protein, partial [Bacteroidota bacterium]|nr:tetratricopeptide repeat protein [Bacteroidota bacterium]
TTKNNWNMRKLVIVLIACLSVISVNAQKNKVVSAINYLKYGELEKAKVAIDKATVHQKTLNWEKTWWVRGKVYQAINDQCMYNQDEKFCELSPDAPEITLQAFMKAINLNFKDEKWHNLDILNKESDVKVFAKLMQDPKNLNNWEIAQDILMNRFPGLANIFVNVGVKQFESKLEEENKIAVESFERSLFFSSMTGKIDTPLYYYTALAAQKSKQYEKAVEYFEQCTKFEYGEDNDNKAYMFYGMAKNNMQLGDTVKYIESLKSGIEKYPDASSSLVTDLINYYLSKDMNQEALDYLEVAIQRSPNNHTYHFAQGSLFDKMGKFDEAKSSYLKSLKIKADFFDANYNLGAIFYNKGVEYFKEANILPLEKQKEFDALMEKVEEEFKLALPYLEKSHELDSKDVSTLVSLNEIYRRLKQYDKSKEISAEIDALQKEE